MKQKRHMIIEQHNSIRNSKKEEIQSHYEFEKDDLECQKEQAEFDRQMEREDREFERLERELNRQERANDYLEQSKATSYSTNYYKPEPLVSSSVLLLLQPYITFEEAVFNSLSYEKERSAPRL